MPTLIQYFDKEPIRSYTLGPSGVAIVQTGFNDLWQGWYAPGTGITYVKDTSYNAQNPTGYHVSGSEDILSSESMSFTFDENSQIWAAASNAGTIDIFHFSGASYVSHISFGGTYPIMYYNVSDNLPENRLMNCFYLKSGQNKIFVRSKQDDFTTEHVFHQDFLGQVRALNHVSRYDNHPYKMNVYGLYANGDGFYMLSRCFDLFASGVFLGFSGMATGVVPYLNEWECSPAANFSQSFFNSSENFSQYPSGTVNYPFNSGDNMGGGYIWQ